MGGDFSSVRLPPKGLCPAELSVPAVHMDVQMEAAAPACFKLPLLEVSIPTEFGLVTAACVLVSMVPYLITGLLGLLFLAKRTTFTLSCLVFLVVVVFINEILLKNYIAMPRPPASCLRSFGMPSGHSAVSMGLLIYMCLEISIRRVETMWKLGICSSLAVLLLPVPLSRIILQDHFPSQVMAGCALGAVTAVLWFCAVQWRLGVIFDQLGSSKALQWLQLQGSYGDWIQSRLANSIDPSYQQLESLLERVPSFSDDNAAKHL